MTVPAASQVAAMRDTPDNLCAGTVLPATKAIGNTLTAGVSSAPSLSTTASTTLFLDANIVNGAHFVSNFDFFLDLFFLHIHEPMRQSRIPLSSSA